MFNKILISALIGAVAFIAVASMAWQKRGAVINYIKHRNTPEYAAMEYMKALQKGFYRSMSSCATQEAENKMRNFAILSEPDLSEDEAVAKHLDEISSLLKGASFSVDEGEESDGKTSKFASFVSEEKTGKTILQEKKQYKKADGGKTKKPEEKSLDVKIVIRWQDASSEKVTLQMVKDKRGRWRCNTPF